MQPDISPLAKRLAEENNVQWQSLYGSGSDGRIVERDVLEYLARVMAGEENLNPTPEPLPAGMEAWPEEVAANAAPRSSGAQPSAHLLGVSSADDAFTGDDSLLDIDLSFKDVPETSDLAAAEGVQPDPLEDGVSEDIFLFDDSLDISDSGGSASDDAFGAEPLAGSALYDDVSDEGGSDDSFVFSDPTPDAETGFDLTDAAAEPNAAARADFNFDEDFAEAAAPTEDASAQDSQSDADPLDDDWDTLELTNAAAPNPPAAQDVALFDDSASSSDSGASDVLFLDEATESAALPTGGEADPATSAVSNTDSGAGRSAAPLQLVSYGILLRRHIDLSKLLQAQAALEQELKQAGPVELTSLLLRAAAKALGTAPLNAYQSVGLAVFGNSVQVVAIPNVLTRPFSEVAAQTAQPDTTSQVNTDFGVIVADMSKLDVDEAILNAGAPVLTLGRIVQDSGEGTRHSTLALSGEMTVEQGTKFLAAVTELLASPIRLVV